MDEKEFLREKEKLKQVIENLEFESEEIQNSLANTDSIREKDDYVKAQMMYLGHKKLQDLKQIKKKPYFARIDFKSDGEPEEELYIGKLSIIDSKTQERWKNRKIKLQFTTRFNRR